MKNKNIQLYNNTCGIEVINNILQFYSIKDEVKINLYKNGIKIKDIKECLKKYFDKVEAVLINLNSLKKSNKPFILLLEAKDNNKHYVLVYKITRKYIYILDSAYKYSYKVKKENITKISKGYGIIVDNVKKTYKKLKKHRPLLIIFISIFEAIFTLGLTYILQELVDNFTFNAFIYIIIETFIVLLSFLKIKLYLKSYKLEDNKISDLYLSNLYNLDENFIKSHDKNEIYYRLFDYYSLKSYRLTLIYLLISDLVMIILSSILLIYYSYFIALILFAILLCFSFIYYYLLKSISTLLENKRKSENDFLTYFKDSFNQTYISDNNIIFNVVKEKLTRLQKDDYLLEKKNNYKNFTLLLFNSLINTSLIIIYYLYLYKYLTIGYLIALINLVNLVLSYLLNVLSYIANFSNIKQIKKRLDDLNVNQKNKNIY